MSSSGEAAITVPHGGMSSFTFSAAAPASKATKVEFVVLSDKNMFGIKHGYNARLMDLYKVRPGFKLFRAYCHPCNDRRTFQKRTNRLIRRRKCGSFPGPGTR